jgi:hypothetical protein
MIPRDSTARSEFEHTKALRLAYLNARSSNLSLVRVLGRSWSLASFLRTVMNWGKRDRYFDTGESGETYDAEMEVAAAAI